MSIADPSIYEILPERTIRLLHIAPGKIGEPLHCSLEAVSLDKLLPYTALSYTWGTPEKDHIVTCNAMPMGITKNLHEALQKLRNPETPCTVWADAICINQSNIQERGQQVLFMRERYSASALTVVYLGKAGWNGTLVSMLGTTIIELAKRLPPNYRIAMSQLDGFGLPPERSEAWLALREFLKLPWFQRVWIVQEFAVSPRLCMVYGSQTYGAPFVSTLIEAITGHGLTHLLKDSEMAWEEELEAAKIMTRIRWLTKLRASVLQGEEPHLRTFCKLLNRQILHRATEHHDQIYALQGLSLEGNDPRLEPKYDWTVTETFLQTCRYFVSTDQLDFLYATGEPHVLPGLPSWVPDWSTPKLASSISKNTVKAYYATGMEKNKFRLSEDSRTLVCRGEVMDSLAGFCSKFVHVKEAKNWGEKAPWFEETENMTRRCKAVTSGESTLAEVHYRTLVTNQGKVLPVTIEAYHIFKDTISKGRDEVVDLEDSRKGAAFFAAIAFPATERKYCITKDGRVGQAPADAEPGDEICFILGLVVPFVVRRLPGKPGQYTLIGECYIDGCMDDDNLERPHDRLKEIVLV